MNLDLKTIAEWTGAKLSGQTSTIDAISIDSRTPCKCATLFIALIGPNFDGHDFIEQAIEQGATAVLTSKAVKTDVPTLVVDDTLAALQTLAERWRERFKIPIVGITGSNGKTIVKDMLSQILSGSMSVAKSPGSYNSQIGVALSLLSIRDTHDIAIVEAGISKPGEMDILRRMIKPTIGVITNIGTAHASTLGRPDQIALEKAKLVADCDYVVVPPLRQFDAIEADHVVSLERLGENDWKSTTKKHTVDRSLFEVEGRFGTENFELFVPGMHNIKNATTAIVVAHHLKVPVGAMRTALSSYRLPKARMEIVTTASGITIINDAHTADFVSSWEALANLERYGAEHRKIAVLGSMTGSTASEHEQIGAAARQRDIDFLIAIGESAPWYEAGFGEVTAVSDLDELQHVLDDLLVPDDYVLFKASKALALDRVAEQFVDSVGPTRLEIDLDALQSNFHAIRQHLNSQVKMMAVVKSFAYGSDSTRIAQTLQLSGVDWLAVAYADEAISLRRKGITLPILVTNTRVEESDKIVKYDLTGLVQNEEQVRAIALHAKRRKTIAYVHVEVDMQMNRLGVKPENALAFCELIRDTDHVQLNGVMTHFASADDETQDKVTLEVIAEFDQLRQQFEKWEPRPEFHAANTAATWRFPQAHFDIVRVGLGLYGVAPSKTVKDAAQMEPVLKLSTRVLASRIVKTGEPVGYGGTWIADRDSKIATIAIGYSDGFLRYMSNGGQVLINGVAVPVVGTVCMDVSMVDVTDIPDVVPGDEVVIFGQQGDCSILVSDVAARGNTIPYEVLTNISPRVRRLYLRK